MQLHVSALCVGHH